MDCCPNLPYIPYHYTPNHTISRRQTQCLTLCHTADNLDDDFLGTLNTGIDTTIINLALKCESVAPHQVYYNDIQGGAGALSLINSTA